jgi:hypothetical protein
MLDDIKVPNSALCRDAGELARLVSGDMLYNHLMRCYLLGEVYARIRGFKIDREQLFLSAMFHDLALTDFVRGAHRFEIESAHAAREFLLQKGATKELAQNVWDNIALHTWDMNMFRSETSQAVQFGITFDVVGFPGVEPDPKMIYEMLRRYPRLGFTKGFHALLEADLNSHQPYPHAFHPCSRIAHNSGQLVIADLSTLQEAAPFAE